MLERNIFFFREWVPYFVSLQEDHVLLFKTRERWEQGLKPDKVRCVKCELLPLSPPLTSQLTATALATRSLSCTTC